MVWLYKTKYRNNAILCYIDTYSFIILIEIEGLKEDELRKTILTEFVALRPKTYSYLADDDKNFKETKETKKCVIKRILKFNNCKNCLLRMKSY